MSSLLAAAALVVTYQDPTYWELSNAYTALRLVHKKATSYLHLRFSGQQTVRDLYRTLQEVVQAKSPEINPFLTIFVAEHIPIQDFNSTADKIILASGFPAQSSIVVMLDHDGSTRIAHSTFSTDPRSWYPHRIDTTLSWLSTNFKARLDTPLHSIPIVSSFEMRHLLKWSTAPTSSQSAEYMYSPMIHHYFERAAQLTPSAVAIQWQNRVSVTYADLDRKCNALAAHLIHSQGLGRGDFVLLFFDKGVEMIVALIAVLKAGAAYVPLDIDHPTERLGAIQKSCRAKFCLTTTNLSSMIISRIQTEASVKFLAVDNFLSSPQPHMPCQRPDVPSSGSDLCYIMYTSGTTGVPKGVMVPHSAVVASVINGPQSNQQLRKEGAKLRTLMFSNYAFDYSTWDIYLTLTSGGCLCIASKNDMLTDLTGVLNSMSITFLETTPTILALIDPAQIPTLNTVYSSGEPLTAAVRDKFQTTIHATGDGVPQLRLGNGGAPTETTVMSAFTIINAGDDPRTFGRPFGTNRLYVLNANKELCPIGAVGQLWIGGDQVTAGYIGRPDLTEMAFQLDPFDCEGGKRKMYNTGDLCSWTEEGQLLHLGRADSQVKIRGQRIETSEVECVLRNFPHTVDAKVLKQSIDNNEKLVAFVVAEVRDINVAAMMKFMSARLPRYMVPSDIIPVATFPVTSNGKIDRRALASLVLQSADTRQNRVHDAAFTVSEALVASAWAKVLNILQAAIPLDRTFLESGGDSISAIRVAALCRTSGIIISFNDFNDAPTVRAQAALIDARIASGGKTAKQPSYLPFELLTPENYRTAVLDAALSYGLAIDDIEDAYPCTAYISGLISLSASNPESYMAHYTFEKPGAFKSSHMETAWRKVFQRHGILRTVAIITPGFSNGITHIVLSGANHLEWSCTSYVDQRSRDMAVEVYLQSAPGFSWGQVSSRAALFQGPESSVLAWQVHHSQFDGWSFPQILNDLKSSYDECNQDSETTTRSSPPPYAAFVRWVNQQDPTKALDYWKSHLIDVSPLSWPKVSHKYAASISTDGIQTQPWTRGQDVAKFCAARQLTMSSLIRAALAVVLGIHEGTEDVLFGVVTSGRTGDLIGIEDIVGSCIAAFPCRIRVPSHSTLEQVLSSVHEQSVASIPYQFVGLSDIIQVHPGGANFRSLFNILLVIENLPGLNDADHTFVGRNLRGHRLGMNYPLCITVFPTADKSELQFQFQWDSRCLSSTDIRWFSSHFFTVLDTFMASPEQEVRHVSMLSEEEEHFVRSVGVGLSPHNSTLLAHKFFHTLVDEIATHLPSSIAVECLSGVTVSYGTLIARANQAAHGLQLRGVGPEVLVPIIFDKFQSGVNTVVSLLAVMKSGGAFVPLDSSWPADRLASCIRQMRSKFLICDSFIPEVTKALDVSFVTLEELSQGHDIRAPLTEGLYDSSLSYVIYTSGSTGSPKGVMIEHSNVMAFIANTSTLFPLESAKRFLHFSPWSFDVGLADMFLAFSKGGTLVLADMNQMLSDLSGVLNFSRVDYAVLTPPVAQLLQSNVDHPHLRSLVVTGERLPRQLSNQWRDKIVFLDAYGPTEVTVQCIGINHSAAVPTPGVIGKPFGTTRAYILDDSMKISPVGVVGELCLAGNQVGRGYLEMPEETSRVFVRDPFDNNYRRMYRSGDLARWTSDGFIEYLGRQDGGFVKMHGLRIDVAEVEATMMLREKTFAVVELVELEGQSHLLAFLSRELAPPGASQIHLNCDPVASRGWIQELIGACRLVVPSYTIPSLWIVLDAMPQANSNKVDRKKLRQFFGRLSSEGDLVQSITRDLLNVAPPRPPQDAFEQILLDLWTQILEIDTISVQDDFFTLGGNSIKSIIFLSRLHRYGWTITLEEFRNARTIVRLAEIVKAITSPSSRTFEGTVTGGLVVQIQSARSAEEKTRSPIWFIHDGAGFIGPDYWLIDHLDREVYGISNPSTDQSVLESNYPTFESFSTQYLPLIPSDQDVFIAGWSSGGNIALDVAVKRRARGMPVKGVILLDTFNTEGWKLLNPALNPGYERGELQVVHVKHTTLLMEQVLESSCDFPVLLIQAGSEHPLAIPDVWEYPPLPVTERIDTRHKRNFYTIQNLPFMEIVRVEEANHFSMLLESPYRQTVSSIIRRWCQ